MSGRPPEAEWIIHSRPTGAAHWKNGGTGVARWGTVTGIMAGAHGVDVQQGCMVKKSGDKNPGEQ